jgi:uncharacterized protein with PIN domain
MFEAKRHTGGEHGAMRRILIRFYQELNDFLPPEKRKVPFEVEAADDSTAKSVIEDLGVPHTEVDLILANGTSVDFSYRPADGDSLSVYPVFESLDISEVTRLRPEPLRILRFVCDVHLGKLSSFLRLLGFDTAYGNAFDDEQLLAISRAEGRILFTRDRGLLKRRELTHGYCVRSTKPREQLAEVVSRFSLHGRVKPFSRCIACNTPLRRIGKNAAMGRIPALVSELYDDYAECPSCLRVFWRGTHWERMKKLADEVLGGGVV